MSDTPPPAQAADPPGKKPPGKKIETAVSHLNHWLDKERIGTGALAEIRRMDPLKPALPPAAWRLLVSLELEDQENERAWAIILHGMAQLAPAAHHPATVGDVLARTDYSEARFIRLLRAEGAEEVAYQTRLVCRWLSTKAEKINWIEFAHFLLSRITRPESEEAEKQSHTLARAYFRTLSQKNSKSEESNS
jgi:CRISPR type I-E-associated protein CasB/Cse2